MNRNGQYIRPAGDVNAMVREYQTFATPQARNRVLAVLSPWIESHARGVAVGRQRLEPDEAVSAGTMGVMRAMDMWPDDKGDDFLGYAYRFLIGHIKRAEVEMNSAWSVNDHKTAQRTGVPLPERCGTFEASRGDGLIGVIDLLADETSLPADEREAANDAFLSDLQGLNPAAFRVMALLYANNQSVEEIADNAGIDPARVRSLLEEAHASVLDRLIDAAGCGQEIDMVKFSDDLMSHAKFAIAAAAERQVPPEKYLAEVLMRDKALLQPALETACRMMVEQARELLKSTPPKFNAPLRSAAAERSTKERPTFRQPPRGLEAINAANVSAMQCMLDNWKMPGGRSLGDIKGDELGQFVASERRSEAKHAARRQFYEALELTVPAGVAVRTAVDERYLQQLYRHTCERMHVEFAPTEEN